MTLKGSFINQLVLTPAFSSDSPFDDRFDDPDGLLSARQNPHTNVSVFVVGPFTSYRKIDSVLSLPPLSLQGLVPQPQERKGKVEIGDFGLETRNFCISRYEISFEIFTL
ncbi:hypothetical protein ACTXT7_002075 [Hymenolepis weldensis]